MMRRMGMVVFFVMAALIFMTELEQYNDRKAAALQQQ